MKNKFIFLALLFSLLFFINIIILLNSGIMTIGSTIVEREVFENSYQRSEGIKEEIAINKAVEAEIEERLKNREISEEERRSLEIQKSAIKIRIETAKLKRRE